MSRFTGMLILAGFIVLWTCARAQESKKPVSQQIPKKVMEGLKARFPRPEVEKWTRETEGDLFMYDIEFRQDGHKFEADIKEDGTIHNWEAAIAPRDLPKVVRNAVEKAHPGSRIKEAMQITSVKNGKEELEGYEIVLATAGKKQFEITVAPDGKILEDSAGKK